MLAPSLPLHGAVGPGFTLGWRTEVRPTPTLNAGHMGGVPNYRRLRIPGGTYFFTVTLAERRARTLVANIDLLRAAYAATRARLPFLTDAVVVLPDHLHAVWTLPQGDADFPARWKMLRAAFSRALPPPAHRSHVALRRREKGIWQRRYWEHAIRDGADYRAYVEYCWWNPVKHGHAARPADWPHSSFHRDLRRGLIPPDRAGGP